MSRNPRVGIEAVEALRCTHRALYFPRFFIVADATLANPIPIKIIYPLHCP
ncbi:MAG: hypothetical protein LUC23_04125 [Prevotellaceae bacterium]|nr:hypothetical protein [Prevotellaceae bacterium]